MLVNIMQVSLNWPGTRRIFWHLDAKRIIYVNAKLYVTNPSNKYTQQVKQQMDFLLNFVKKIEDFN